MTTTTKITLVDLARAVNRLIEEAPDKRNPLDGWNCVYHDEATDDRCLIGQALYDLTGRNMPSEYEGQDIQSLLNYGPFRRYFGLDVDSDSFDLVVAIDNTQGLADTAGAWGTLDKINVVNS